jgi:hypothetical protein
MTARITTDIFCDVCGQWEHGATSDRPERRLSRAELKKIGWRFIRGPEGEWIDVCPLHKEAADKESLDVL